MRKGNDMKKILWLVLPLVFIFIVGCEQAAWFASGAVTDAALQAEQRKQVYADLLNDPNMTKILVEAAGAGITTPEQEQLILNAIEQYEKIHGTVSVIKSNAKDPAWWIAFVLGLTAAYQKRQRIIEKKT